GHVLRDAFLAVRHDGPPVLYCINPRKSLAAPPTPLIMFPSFMIPRPGREQAVTVFLPGGSTWAAGVVGQAGARSDARSDGCARASGTASNLFRPQRHRTGPFPDRSQPVLQGWSSGRGAFGRGGLSGPPAGCVLLCKGYSDLREGKRTMLRRILLV